MGKCTLLLVVLGLTALTGCRTTIEADPSVEVETDGYRVTVDSSEPRSRHCPPGLARQGRC